MRYAVTLAALLTLGAADPVAQTAEVRVGTAPLAVTIDGQRQIFYELHVSNFARRPWRLERLDVLDRAGTMLATHDRAALEQRIDGAGLAPDATERTLVAPGSRVVVFVELPVAGRAIPALRHRLVLSGDTGSVTVTAPEAAVATAPLPELGPPLQGGLWAAVYAPDMNFGHRRYVYALGGVARIPGRFAIDWFRVEPDGSRRKAGGEPVLAVADAVVAATRDDVPDAKPATRPALGDATGNYVALALDGGRHAFYEHLRQDVRVRPGQRVRRGQVIGFVGASGQASEPHLHFHVANANSPLAAEGMPYRLSGFTRIGGYADIRAFDRAGPFAPAAPAAVVGLPPANSVGRFAAPAPGTAPMTAADLFFARFRTLCGKTFAGRLASDDPADAAFAGKPLVARAVGCTEREVRIAFDVGDDRSRTWIVTRTATGLRLKHRHLLKDGSVDPVSDYGGDTITAGTPRRQAFPADAESKAMFAREGRQVSLTNVWAFEIEPGVALTYELARPGRRFRVTFDLARPGA